ncbi:phosphatidylinositol 4-phosphate 5-kinase [Acrasis kona]|uniref:Phosphatidylinositol 4-phosphate 5-kinase n=1 Tax=Acrasis kona TaxID=1008807 RepID=A0AAW2YTQ7_9EUKA
MKKLVILKIHDINTNKEMMHWGSKNKYGGDFVDGKPHGCSQPNGRGVFYHVAGDKYEDEMELGNFKGDGIYMWPNGLKYVGQFTNSQPNGRGSYYFDSGHIYTGMVKDGVICGTGKIKYADGNVYEGVLDNGFPNGEGVYTTAEGNTYSGMFLKGEMHGLIIQKDANNICTVETNYKHGVKNGQSKLRYADGRTVIINYLNGELTGGVVRCICDGKTVQ